jgi:hypothetical protein
MLRLRWIQAVEMHLSQRIFCLDCLTVVDGIDPLTHNIGNSTTNQRCANVQDSEDIQFLETPLAIVITLVWFCSAASL